MTAVDHAELKRLADELVQILAPDQGERAHPAFGLAVRIQSAHAALLSEIEGLKARAMLADMMSAKLERRTRLLDEAERQLAALRTQAPDSWRPIETAPKDGTRVLLSGMPYGPKVDVGAWGITTYNRSAKAYNRGWTTFPGNETNPTHWMPLPAAPALSPQTAESGK